MRDEEAALARHSSLLTRHSSPREAHKKGGGMAQPASHLIPESAAVTLDGLFPARGKSTPELVAYRTYNEQHSNWRDYTWAQIDRQVARWQAALEKDGLKAGDRVAIMM